MLRFSRLTDTKHISTTFSSLRDKILHNRVGLFLAENAFLQPTKKYNFHVLKHWKIKSQIALSTKKSDSLNIRQNGTKYSRVD